MQLSYRKRMYLNKKVTSVAVGVYDCKLARMPQTISSSCGDSVPLDRARAGVFFCMEKYEHVIELMQN